MSPPKPFILVDGSSYLFRAYYALPPLTNAAGNPTGAIYGVLNMLRRLMADYSPQQVAIIFDPKGKTFRNDLYPEYKANRAAMPDDLRQQIQPLHAAIKALGLPLIVKEGVEADDVIGTLAKQAEKAGYQVLISTGDKDMAQLVNDKITLINTMTNKALDVAGVKEKFGVAPNKIIDYLALMGDTADNIPGVPKVGPKTAAKWITEFGGLDEILQSADKIKGKVGENLRNHRAELPLARELVTLKLDVELDRTPEQLKLGEPDRSKLIELFTTLEFNRWREELLKEKKPAPSTKKYKTITTEKEFNAFCKKIKTQKLFALDTETTSLDALSAKLVGISLALDDQAVYIPLAHDYPDVTAQLPLKLVLDTLKPLLQDKKNTIIGQNLKYDIEVLNQYGLNLEATILDTMIESYVLNSSATRHDMDSLAAKYLGLTTTTFEDVAGKGAKQITFDQVKIDVATDYAAEDADITLQLQHKLYPMLEEDQPRLKVFYRHRYASRANLG